MVVDLTKGCAQFIGNGFSFSEGDPALGIIILRSFLIAVCVTFYLGSTGGLKIKSPSFAFFIKKLAWVKVSFGNVFSEKKTWQYAKSFDFIIIECKYVAVNCTLIISSVPQIIIYAKRASGF